MRFARRSRGDLSRAQAVGLGVRGAVRAERPVRKMDALGVAAGALVLLAGTVSCEAPGGDQGEPAEPEEEVQLDLAVDRVDFAHGALRLGATMVDGAADVRMTLGEACDRREVGRGTSTLSSLVWLLGETDVADALGCGLVVRAHVPAQGRYLTKVAPLS